MQSVHITHLLFRAIYHGWEIMVMVVISSLSATMLLPCNADKSFPVHMMDSNLHLLMYFKIIVLFMFQGLEFHYTKCTKYIFIV